MGNQTCPLLFIFYFAFLLAHFLLITKLMRAWNVSTNWYFQGDKLQPLVKPVSCGGSPWRLWPQLPQMILTFSLILHSLHSEVQSPKSLTTKRGIPKNKFQQENYLLWYNYSHFSKCHIFLIIDVIEMQQTGLWQEIALNEMKTEFGKFGTIPL